MDRTHVLIMSDGDGVVKGVLAEGARARGSEGTRASKRQPWLMAVELSVYWELILP